MVVSGFFAIFPAGISVLKRSFSPQNGFFAFLGGFFEKDVAKWTGVGKLLT